LDNTSIMELTVYKYKTTGKLVAGFVDHQVFDLNNDLTFSSNFPHKINHDTVIEALPYKIDVSLHKSKYCYTIKKLLAFKDEKQTVMLKYALEDYSVEMSPSRALTLSERSFIGTKAGNSFGSILFPLGLLLFFLSGLRFYFLPIGILLMTSVLWLGNFRGTRGDPGKEALIMAKKQNLKERLRFGLQADLNKYTDWSNLDGISFENAVASIFKDQQYGVETTPRSYDQGIDLILHKEKNIIAVQCKAHKVKIGANFIRELVGARLYFPHATSFMLVSLNGFTNEAISSARDNGILLYSIKQDFLKLP